MLAPSERHFQETVLLSEQGWHIESLAINPSRDICTHLYLSAAIGVPQGSEFPAVWGTNPLDGFSKSCGCQVMCSGCS